MIHLPPFTPVHVCFQPVAGPGQLEEPGQACHERDPLSHTISSGGLACPIPFAWLGPVSTDRTPFSQLLRACFRLNSFSMTSASCSLHVS